MHKKDASSLLKESIAKMEAQQAEEKKLFIEELSYTFEHLKPINVIKDTVTDLISTLHARKNLLTTLLGAGAGYMASSIFGPKPTMLNKLGARLFQQVVTIAVTQNSQVITDYALNLVTNLRRKVESQKQSPIVPNDLIQNGGDAF